MHSDFLTNKNYSSWYIWNLAWRSKDYLFIQVAKNSTIRSATLPSLKGITFSTSNSRAKQQALTVLNSEVRNFQIKSASTPKTKGINSELVKAGERELWKVLAFSSVGIFSFFKAFAVCVNGDWLKHLRCANHAVIISNSAS